MPFLWGVLEVVPKLSETGVLADRSKGMKTGGWIALFVGVSTGLLLAQPAKGIADAKQVLDALYRYHQGVLKDPKLMTKSKFRVGPIGSTKERVVESDNPRWHSTYANQHAFRLAGGHGTFMGVLGHDRERASLEEALTGWREWVFLIGNKKDKLTNEKLQVTDGHGWGAIIPDVKDYPQNEQALALAKKTLGAKKPITRAPVNGWVWASRIVTLDSPSCLRCHKDSQKGDPAGVMVYAIHRDPTRKAPKKP